LPPQTLIEQISPEFAQLTADVKEVAKASKDPALIAVLLFKLAQERQKTNQLLEEQARKHEQLMTELKNRATPIPSLTNPTQSNTFGGPATIAVLPEADQKILSYVQTQGQADAMQVQQSMGYKNPNAASQRLNALAKQGHLSKIQSGKRVVFLPR
jgi:hypothetical protein